MTLDITGIKSENEFYTHHYLSAILENDLKDVFKEWRRRQKEEKERPPYDKLKGLPKLFFTMQSKLEKETDPRDRQGLQREFVAEFMNIMDYPVKPAIRTCADDTTLPILGELLRPNGAPELWIVEALDPRNEKEDPLSLFPLPCQYEPAQFCEDLRESTFEDTISRQIFGRPEPPRWVMLVSDSQLLLIDRNKWNEKRLLRFDFNEIFGRRETTTFQAMAALLHRESVVPEDRMSLLDTLDENSHKHAYAVSEDLKYALREAIELIGNEAVRYMKEVLHERVFDRKLADQLTLECLRYMYRLLFLLYIEARPELGYVPLNSDAYRQGYSLENLRDLEMVKLTREESRNQFYIHDSIQLLFDLLYNGFPPSEQLALAEAPQHHTFRINPLRCHLFDPKRTPLLNKVKLRNKVLQRIIELMSLTREQGRRKRGRVSYAQLGINQLGAVYEALLSYTGFFAEHDLYEVKKAKDKYNELDIAYFVKADDLPKYTEDEKVYNSDGTLKMYHKGEFIYRLAGRNRQKSASYYTPEVLTKCLVKYALKVLLKGKTADEILHLTVCEPAMGSAAFLNEAVNQLAEEYLKRKQQETGKTIAHEDYTREKQKVKMYIADNNVFGVDLNPIAVELAEVSLWLNTIYEGAFVPWFTMQLVTGNSLIGARRQVFHVDLLKKKSSGSSWLKEVPERIKPGEKRPGDSVYHFLLPDERMAKYNNKVIKELAPENIKKIDNWRKEFTKPCSKEEIKQLQTLSEAVDHLWAIYTKLQISIRERTTDHLAVFGHPQLDKKENLTKTEYKDKIYSQEILSEGMRFSSHYRRLKMVMDYWCTLWFWPIEQADLLPSRKEFLQELSLILKGKIIEPGIAEGEQAELFPDSAPKQLSLGTVTQQGYVNVDELAMQNGRLKLVKHLSEEKYHFLHWELEFSDLFDKQGGFDLVLGNPPWIKVEWDESEILGDAEPQFVIKKFRATKLAELRKNVLDKFDLLKVFLSAYEETTGTQFFLNSIQNYPQLRGMKANLYKCFLIQSWTFGKQTGYSCFLHHEGIYDDSKGGHIRKEIYQRLCFHFQFQNQYMFFPIAHRERYSINLYRNSPLNNIFFNNISNLFTPATIDACFEHNGGGLVPSIKDSNGNWDVKGHKERIVPIDSTQLHIFSKLYENNESQFLMTRLPIIHSTQIVKVMQKFANHSCRLKSLKDSYYSTPHWNETIAQEDGTIKRHTCFSSSKKEFILSGPHFYVGNPLYKTPRSTCTEKSHYDVINLNCIPIDYLPRTNYLPNCNKTEYINRTPCVPWTIKKVTEYYRLIYRAMLPPPNERTLIGAIIPKDIAHTNACRSYVFKDSTIKCGIVFLGLTSSIPFDFYTKSTGRTNLHNMLDDYPLIHMNDLMLLILVRTLLLNCITREYSNLWEKCWSSSFCFDNWTKSDLRLHQNSFNRLSSEWTQNVALRNDYARRQALVEIDVITSIGLSLSIDELQTIYRVYFPVLKQNDDDTWYDQNGHIVFTKSKGLPGVGFSRKEWNEIKDMKEGTVERTIIDDTLPGGPRELTIVYHAPFDRCDREQDYEIAWKEFEQRFKEKGITP